MSGGAGAPRGAFATGLATAALMFVPGAGGSVRSAAAVVITSAWMSSVALDLLRDARSRTGPNWCRGDCPEYPQQR